MLALERRIRPAGRGRHWANDLLVTALLLGLLAVLMPAYGPSWDWLGDRTDQTLDEQAAYLGDVAGQMASNYLLAAMAFALVLRQGGIDLSVWAVAGLGGVVAAALLRAGLSPWLAMPAAVVAGAVLGAANAAMVLRLRAPTVVATLVTSLAVIGALRLATNARELAAPSEAFGDWAHWPSPPLLLARMLIVVVAFGAVLIGLLSSDDVDDPSPRAHRRSLRTALVLSGALSALSGCIWLLDRWSAPLPLRPVGDLRVVSAALLAGAATLRGPGRTLVACVLLPLALLASTAWRQEVLDLAHWGYSLQLVLLMGMVIVAHLAFGRLSLGSRPGWRAGGAALLCAAGVLLVAQSGAVGLHRSIWVFLSAGVASWLGGAVLLTVARMRRA